MVGWRFRKLMREIPRALRFVWDGWKSSHGLSVVDRLRALSRGFEPQSYVVYGLRSESTGKYLTDFDRLVRACDINGSFKNLLGNKLYFGLAMGQFGGVVPKTFGVVQKGEVKWMNPDPSLKDTRDIDGYCAAAPGLVIKPINEGGGTGVMILRRSNGVLTLNGVSTCLKDVCGKIRLLNGYLISEFVEQAAYAANIFADTTNTIRILTVWDDGSPRPFVAAAVHRFGSRQSVPVDNWTSGGFSVAIDLDTGILGRAAGFGRDGQIQWFDKHPDSGAQIAGIKIPLWATVKEEIIAVAERFPFLPYVGWDVLLDTQQRVRIIEGNHNSGVRILQVHGPLLANPRLRAFYQSRNAISRWAG